MSDAVIKWLTECERFQEVIAEERAIYPTGYRPTARAATIEAFLDLCDDAARGVAAKGFAVDGILALVSDLKYRLTESTWHDHDSPVGELSPDFGVPLPALGEWQAAWLDGRRMGVDRGVTNVAEWSGVNSRTFWAKEWGVSLKVFNASVKSGAIRSIRHGDRNLQVDLSTRPSARF